jgi:hypothetical protein
MADRAISRSHDHIRNFEQPVQKNVSHQPLQPVLIMDSINTRRTEIANITVDDNMTKDNIAAVTGFRRIVPGIHVKLYPAVICPQTHVKMNKISQKTVILGTQNPKIGRNIVPGQRACLLERSLHLRATGADCARQPVMPSDLPSSAYSCTQNYVQENLDHLKKHNTFNFVS